jgi:hypothetical protein
VNCDLNLLLLLTYLSASLTTCSGYLDKITIWLAEAGAYILHFDCSMKEKKTADK